MKRYELKLSSGNVIEWDGTSGEHAAQRYVAMFPGAVVVAWREIRHGFFPFMAEIIP